ncbi:methyltransferase domain-containing protein, partial [Bacillus sp. S34]|nr:methyltransferase domain-containing protein [Bacillus sp. S34]
DAHRLSHTDDEGIAVVRREGRRLRVEAPLGVVLDLGCGPGTLTATLATRWPSASVVGLDSSAEMLDSAPVGPSNGDVTSV